MNPIAKRLIQVAIFGGALAASSLGQTWAEIFDYAGGQDIGQKVVVDKEGYVYVAGPGASSGNGVDYVLLKYAPTGGDPIWQVHYDGPTHGNDYAVALCIDNDGNLYVGGYSQGDGTGYDFAVRKWLPNSDVGWTARRDSGSNYNDIATDMAIDKNGNLCICGYTVVNLQSIPENDDVFIVVFEPDGDVKSGWPVTYGGSGRERANAITTDLSSHVVVAGSKIPSLASEDLLVLRFAGGGTQLDTWQTDYAGAKDVANAVTCDPDGIVYIGGEVTNSGDQRFAVYAYEEEVASPIWSQVYNGPSDNDGALAIKELDGLVYATGYSEKATGDHELDVLTVKLVSSDGSYSSTWSSGEATGVRRFTGDYGLDRGNALDVRGKGNVYIVGEVAAATGDTGFQENYLTLRYGPSNTGAPDFHYEYSGAAGGDDAAYSVFDFCVGRIFVTGMVLPSSDYEFGTLLYALTPSAASLTSYSVVVGSLTSGGLSDLESDNGNYMVIANDQYASAGTPNVNLQVQGSDLGGATEMCFEVKSYVNSINVRQEIALYNWSSAEYVVVDSRKATTGARTLHVAPPYGMADYIDGSGYVKAQVRFYTAGITSPSGWSASIDLANWEYIN